MIIIVITIIIIIISIIIFSLFLFSRILLAPLLVVIDTIFLFVLVVYTQAEIVVCIVGILEST